MSTYIAFLRGINVGGHHKVPMVELKGLLAKSGFENIITLLNSGNIILDSKLPSCREVEDVITENLEAHFGFPIPTVVRTSEKIVKLLKHNPFEGIELTKEKRFYISLLKNGSYPDLEIPWVSEDKSFHILEKNDNDVLSVLDLSISGTPDAMAFLEKHYGKGITTRNWKTIERIEKKLSV